MEDDLDLDRLVVLFWALHPRQRQVMFFFVQGKAPPDIAEHLGIRERTVWNHLHEIAKKAKEIDSGE